MPSATEHRERMVLRERLEDFMSLADQAIDPADCICPARLARYDGKFEMGGEVRAQLTCGLCRTSLTVPVREDVAREHGGPRGPASVSDMDSRYHRASTSSTNRPTESSPKGELHGSD